MVRTCDETRSGLRGKGSEEYGSEKEETRKALEKMARPRAGGPSSGWYGRRGCAREVENPHQDIQMSGNEDVSKLIFLNTFRSEIAETLYNLSLKLYNVFNLYNVL